jgi:murein DD-endopeptidase MepM/ murein hydrolase activator NlpD
LFFKNFRQGKISPLLKIVWLISAGVLLLGATSVLAETCLRVSKNGVIYYYFSNHGPPQSRQGGLHTPRLPSLPLQPLIQPTTSLAISTKASPAQSRLLPETAEALPVVNTYEAPDYLWGGTRHLLRLLASCGYHAPLVLPGKNANPRRVASRPEVPSTQESKGLVPGGSHNFRQYAQEQDAAFGPRQQSSYCFKGSNQSYSFPVAFPFSFRNSWGDYRSGGRHHRAVDIFAPEGAPVYAVTAGVIDTLTTWREAGITLLMRGQDGRGYGYMHLRGYAPGIVEGKAVRAGELIGYVGRTGVRRSSAHLHFQVYADHHLKNNVLLNPYGLLVQLCHGVGVTDLHHHKIARLEGLETKADGIQVYRRPGPAAFRGRPVLVIKNF